MTIYTNVLPACSFSVPTGSAETVSITYRCTNGVAPAFTVIASTPSCNACPEGSSTAPIMLSDNGAVGRGMGAGRDLPLVVAAPIATLRFQTASAGAHSGTVTITIAP